MTRRALLSAGLPPNMRIVTVPNGQPRTKPRALNYALQDARRTLVAVFDAEDIPDASQLRRAASAFIEGGPRLACVQARLSIYSADESFLSRQFALEYSALFNGLLPALGFLRLPLTTGGTSNHFRRDLLLKIGGWDPFNVTEDADLGIRLARFGYEVSVIDSVTMEEAPASWRGWRGATHALDQVLDSNLPCPHATPIASMARPRRVEICRISTDDRRHDFVLARAPVVLRVGRFARLVWWPRGAGRRSALVGVGIKSGGRLWSGHVADDGHGHRIGLGAPAAVGHLAAALLAGDVVRRLSRRARPDRQALLLGKDDARHQQTKTTAAGA